MARTKVFVGNLAFKTRETGLTQEFETAGKVIGVTIVSRRGRSLGYGFVEFENEAAAAKAVQALNKKDIDGRQVNVEIAKPRDETAPRPQQPFQGGYAPRGTGYSGGRGGYRSRGGYRGNYYSGQGFRGGRGGFYNNRRGGFKPRGGRLPRQTPEQKNYQPSGTTLYVTNLPFTLTSEQFTKVFTDLGTKPKSVKIISKPNGKSKGYGFAEFENTADQQKALAADKKTIEGREIVVKVALVPPTQPVTPGQPSQQATPSPTQQTKPAPATAQPTATTPKPATTQSSPVQAKPENVKTAPTQSPKTEQKK